MKKAVALFTFFFFISTINEAQDTIVKINGDSIIAKILEVNPTWIKFKKINLLDSPIYSENKSEVKYVIYSNGVKETFAIHEIKSDSSKIVSENAYYQNESPTSKRDTIEQHGAGFKYKGIRIGEREMHQRLMSTNDKEIFELVQSAKSARRKEYIGFGAIPLGIIAAGGILFGYLAQDTSIIGVGGIFLCGTIACPIIAGVFTHEHTKYTKEAIRLYNQRF